MSLHARLSFCLLAALAVAGCGSDEKETPAPAACDSSKAKCGEACVDLTSNPAFCGTCSNACDTGEVCSRGDCLPSCQSGLTNCSGACSKLPVDPDNCGACGNVCGAGLVCSAGTCATTCQANLTTCGRFCIDTTSDFDNCGACGTSCEAGQTCTAGKCAIVCGQGITDCSGKCLDLQTDDENCGKCGTTCGAGEKCSAGACVADCGPGLTACDGSCRDLTSDPSNCGSCGNVCPTAAHGTAVCSVSACNFVCETGFTNCNNSPDDGCESDLLSDPFNCGQCGRSCLGGACQSGMCPVESAAPGLQLVQSPLASDGLYLYYQQGSQLMRQLLGGGTANIFSSGVPGTSAVTEMLLVGDYLYWTELNDGLFRAPLAGSDPEPVATGAAWQAAGLVASEGYVYFVTSAEGSVRRVKMADKTLEVLYSAQPSGNPHHIAVDANNVYWNESSGGYVKQMPKAGGTVVELASSMTAAGLVVSSTHVYFSDFAAQRLARIPIGGGAVEDVLTGVQGSDGELIRDETAIYYGAGGNVTRIPLDGSKPTVMASGQSYTGDMTQDARYVYWIDWAMEVKRTVK